MQIAVKNITENPIEVEDNIPAAQWDLDSTDVRFLDYVHMKGRFSRAGSEILADITIEFTKEITCCRCLDVLIQRETRKIMLSYEISKLGDVLNVDDDVREEILLNWPMKILCSEECKGLDPVTGEKIV